MADSTRLSRFPAVVRSRTAANEDSTTLVVRRCRQCALAQGQLPRLAIPIVISFQRIDRRQALRFLPLHPRGDFRLQRCLEPSLDVAAGKGL